MLVAVLQRTSTVPFVRALAISPEQQWKSKQSQLRLYQQPAKNRVFIGNELIKTLSYVSRITKKNVQVVAHYISLGTRSPAKMPLCLGIHGQSYTSANTEGIQLSR